jgi:mono/diheme cytochrome c family protein
MSLEGTALRRRTIAVLSVYIAWVWTFALISVAQGLEFADGPQATAGKKLFTQSCASCHEVGSRNQSVGPGLKGYYTGHRRSPNDAVVRELIIRGKGAMPGFSSFSDTELTELIAYLKTL